MCRSRLLILFRARLFGLAKRGVEIWDDSGLEENDGSAIVTREGIREIECGNAFIASRSREQSSVCIVSGHIHWEKGVGKVDSLVRIRTLKRRAENPAFFRPVQSPRLRNQDASERRTKYNIKSRYLVFQNTLPMDMP
jgi:hypothetical protein